MSNIINFLLNEVYLRVSNKNCRIVEIELYQSPDPYIHFAPEQLTSYRWYFHKSNKSSMTNSGYKGGTYKGLDLTFGTDQIYGGILIRSIEVNGIIIEGPCKVVDFILQETNFSRIEDLVAQSKIYPPLALDSSFPVYLIPSNLIPLNIDYDPRIKINRENGQRHIYQGPRVGLSLKQGKLFELRLEYLMKPLRFTTVPKRLKKSKILFVLNRFKVDSKNFQPIESTFNVKSSTVNRWFNLFLEGQLKTLDQIQEIKTVKDQCLVYGYCYKLGCV